MEILASKRFKRKPSTFNHLDYCFHHYILKKNTQDVFYWVRQNRFFPAPTYIKGYLIPSNRKEMMRSIDGVLYSSVIFKEEDLKGHYH